MKIEGLLVILFILCWISGLLSVLIGFFQLKKLRSLVAKFHPTIEMRIVPTDGVPPAFVLQWVKRMGILLLCFGTGRHADNYLQLFMDTATLRRNGNLEVIRNLNRTLFFISWFAASLSVGILSLSLLFISSMHL
jgi:hypothetical protein